MNIMSILKPDEFTQSLNQHISWWTHHFDQWFKQNRSLASLINGKILILQTVLDTELQKISANSWLVILHRFKSFITYLGTNQIKQHMELQEVSAHKWIVLLHRYISLITYQDPTWGQKLKWHSDIQEVSTHKGPVMLPVTEVCRYDESLVSVAMSRLQRTAWIRREYQRSC